MEGRNGQSQEEELWKKAQSRGMSRREFLGLLSLGGAAAVAMALAPGEAVALAKREAITFDSPPPAQPPPPLPIHVKPVPAELFIDHGGNRESRLELKKVLSPLTHYFSFGTTPPLLG